MPPFTRARVLIVARQTADSDQLVQAVSARANEGACSFTLMIPAAPIGVRPVGAQPDCGLREAERQLSRALPLLSQAAGAEVVGIVGSPEPFAAVQDALKLLGFDEVIVSVLPPRLVRRRHDQLPEKIRGLGLPVTEVGCAGSSIQPVPAA